MTSILDRLLHRRRVDFTERSFESILHENYDLLSRCLVVSPEILSKLKSVQYARVHQVHQQMKEDHKVTELLNILNEIPVSQQQLVYNALIEALRQDGQEHVANIFQPVSDARPMSDEHYQLLVRKQKQVCQCLDPLNGLVDKLVGQKVFSDTNRRIVLQKKDCDRMSRKVINILLRKPDSAFDAFISALCATKQEHVASLLGHNTKSLPMTDEHRQLLNDNKKELAKCMDISYELIDALATTCGLSSNEEKQILNKPNIEAMCLHVVNIILRKPDSVFEAFISALCACKQEHVASLLGHECTEKPMTEKHRQLLISKSEELSQFINPTHSLLSRLVAVDVLSKRQIESVMSKSINTEMSLELVNILLRKSDSSFEKFIEALNNTEQQHVVYILNGQGESPLSHLRRLVLRKSRNKLLSRIDTLHTILLAKLISSEVLTDDDKQRIEAHKVNEDRTAELIDVIARKSQLAYDKFLQALKDSGHLRVAVALEGIELRGRIDPHFLSVAVPSERRKTVDIVRNNMKALVGGTGPDIEELTSLMEQNGFAVSDVTEGSILISFRCFSEESFVNLRRLYTDKTLDKLFTQVFCPQFAQQGLESLTLNITDDEFEVAETFRRIFDPYSAADQQTAQKQTSLMITLLPVELLELVLMRTFIALFTDQYKLHYKTHEAIRLSYSSVAAVCNNWWQTMNGWRQSTTRDWFKHRLCESLRNVCRPYVVCPRLQSRLSIRSRVWAVTQCDNKLFVVCWPSSKIRVFGPNNCNKQPTIELKEMNSPTDIVSCTETKQLYVAGKSSICGECVWRVSLDGRQVVKWLPNKLTTSQFSPFTLSVTSRRLLVTSQANSELLLNGADGLEVKRIPLPDMEWVQHAVETSHGTFILSHSKPQPRVCEVNIYGHVIRVYSDPQQLVWPAYLSLDSDGRVFVADRNKQHILLLNSRLELERVLLDKQQLRIIRPWRLCYTEQTGQLVVSGGELLSSPMVTLFTVR